MAKKLIDFLAGGAVEKRLLEEHYLGYSVRTVIPIKALNVDYVECAHKMRRAIELALTILQDRQ